MGGFANFRGLKLSNSPTSKISGGSLWVALVLLLAMVASAVSPISPAFAVGTGTLVGTVSSETGAPVSGAGVYLWCGQEDSLNQFNASTSTNVEGTYSFSGLEARSCNVSVQKTGFAGKQTTVASTAGQVVFNLSITSATGASIAGSVLGAEVDGIADLVPGVELALTFEDGESFWYATATSAGDGSFTFPAVPHTITGSYSLSLTPGADAPDYFPIQNLSLEVSPGSNVRDLSLTPFPVGEATLIGQVKDEATGMAVAGAAVTLEYSLGNQGSWAQVSKTATTDDGGIYIFEGIFSNSYYSISVSKAGFKTIEDSQYRFRTGDSVRSRDFLLSESVDGLGSYSAQLVNSDLEPITDYSLSA